MTRIGAADQILLLLREQLRKAERRTGRGRSEEAGKAGPVDPHQRLAALASLESLPDRDLRRAMIRGLLAERFGEELTSDPAFEAVALEVVRIMEDSPETQALVDSAIASLKQAGNIRSD
ncbi:hypothetical protein [Sphingomonas sp. DT-204]|uniref:hypothetical protein n=1 Tax=Sphingomonas sp. DT-204 TaxID=3396166 RepID=UPI003F1B4167